MSDAVFHHIPVLAGEVLENLTFPTERPARLIDGTLGGGGHSGRLLEKYPQLELLGIDRDEAALESASEHLAFAGKRVRLCRGNFSDMAQFANDAGWTQVDGILLDLGVSSPQIDRAERGFSWRMEGPLDMRMDRRDEWTASRILNRCDEAELERIFREYGEIHLSRRLAAAVVARRQEKPFAVTGDLVEVCDDVLGKAHGKRLPAPTLAFQALRIAVNGELSALETVLPEAVELLSPGGRLAVISFHSLEDRMVKNFIREKSLTCTCPPGLPVCICHAHASLRPVTKKALTASEAELAANRRSACAKLRVAEKLD